MNKDLHNMDDLFRSRLNAYKEFPSSGLKEGLMAALDKKDAESYKRRFIGWKRMALLLFILLTALIIYETVFRKKDSFFLTQKTTDKPVNLSSSDRPQKSFQKENPRNKNIDYNTINEDYNAPDSEAIINKLERSNNREAGHDNLLTHPKQEDITIPLITGIYPNPKGRNNGTQNRSLLRNSNPEKEQSNSVPGIGRKEIIDFEKTPGMENIANEYKERSSLKNEKGMPLPSLITMAFARPTVELPIGIKQRRATNDSLIKDNLAKNIKRKKQNHFKAYWMLTAFSSYEGVGYRLDSDLPNTIDNIKHNEVHEPSFSIGMLATRQLRRQWGLQTGFIYSQTEIGISPKKLFALQDPGGRISFKYITSTGYAYIKPELSAPPAIGDSLITKEGKHSLKTVSVPLVMKYLITHKRLSFTPGAGIEGTFLTSAKVETEVTSPSNPELIFIKRLDGAKPFYISLVADAEFRYHLNNKLSLSFRPTLKLALSPITENNVVETFPRSMGAGLGLTYRF